MRHLYGVVLGVLLAAAVFFGAAWGYMFASRGIDASTAANNSPPPNGALPAGGGSLFQNAHVMVGGGTLLAVGLAAGLLMVIPWVSPLAAGLPGLVLVAWTALYVSDVREAVRLIPLTSRDFGVGFEALLFPGLLGMAGLAMIVPLFIPSRWRRPPRVPGYGAFGESTLAQPATAFPGTNVFPGTAVSPGTGESPEADVSQETAGSDLDATITGFTTPSGGDSKVIHDWAPTRSQPGPVIPPDGSQAPGGTPDQG